MFYVFRFCTRILCALICLHFAPYGVYCTAQRVHVNRCFQLSVFIHLLCHFVHMYTMRVVLVGHTIVVPNIYLIQTIYNYRLENNNTRTLDLRQIFREQRQRASSIYHTALSSTTRFLGGLSTIIRLVTAAVDTLINQAW